MDDEAELDHGCSKGFKACGWECPEGRTHGHLSYAEGEVEHKHKEPKGGTGGEAETHAKGHKEEEHGITGGEGEAGKEKGGASEKKEEKKK